MAKGDDFQAHLRIHSEYSLEFSLLRLEGKNNLGSLARQRGIGAMALTDHNNIFGAIKFYRSCVQAGIKPILGCQALMGRAGMDRFWTTILVLDATGFGSLSRLLSRAQEREEERGVIEPTWLEPNSTKGLIMLSGYEGELGQALRAGALAAGQRSLGEWRERLGADSFFCELSLGGRVDEEAIAMQLARLARAGGVAAAAAHPCLFAKSGDFAAHEVRACIAQNWQFRDTGRPRPFAATQYLLSAAELKRIYEPKFPGALANAAEIARMCNYDFAVDAPVQLPRQAGTAAAAILYEQARQGLLAKQPQAAAGRAQAYRARLERELEVIVAKDYADYYLIVAELVAYAKAEGIPVGPGRGSGAGSLVAYALGITAIDPIVHGLLFERFLNPERHELPDFDIDFCMWRRDEVIARARERFGAAAVAQIATFGTLRAKAVVRDVGRVLGLSFSRCDHLARLIPNELSVTLNSARRDIKEISRLLRTDSELAELWSFARHLEGLSRTVSTHAGGVLIAPHPLVNFCPLFYSAGKTASDMISQYDKDDIETIGLVKFDFLGLRTLTIIDLAVKMIRSTSDPDFVLDDSCLGEPQAYRIFQQADTLGVFQCEAAGIRDVMRQMQPRSLKDVAVLISLYRPGPIEAGMTSDYLERRTNSSRVNPLHPIIEPILAETHGTIVFQEQVMQVAQALAGYSLGQADILRKAMGKKDPQTMVQQRNTFVTGAKGKLSNADAHSLFTAIEKFAGYAFNKSHAIGYAMLAVQTAYLKACYPAAFFAATMTANMNFSDQLEKLFEDSRRRLKFLNPNVNKSRWMFWLVDEKSLRFGLGVVKGLGRAAAEEIVRCRPEGGYQSLEDLCMRVPPGTLNRMAMENLVRAGACDSLMPTQSGTANLAAVRSQLFASIESTLEVAKHRREHAGQEELFDGGQEDRAVVERPAANNGQRWFQTRKLLEEIKAIGMPISGNMFKTQKWLLGNYLYRPLAEAREEAHGCWGGGLIRVITPVSLRKQGVELIVLDDGDSSLQVRVDDEVWAGVKDATVGTVLLVRGTVVRNKRGELQLKANQVRGLADLCASHLAEVEFDPGLDARQRKIEQLVTQLRRCQRGRCRIAIVVYSEYGRARQLLGNGLALDSRILTQIKEEYGIAINNLSY